VVADVLGAVLLSFLVFGTYAEPLEYERAQLWAGVSGFLIVWGLAAHSQELYSRAVVFGERRRLIRRAFATCLLAFGLILALAFGFKFIGAVSRLWLVAWAITATSWVVLARIIFRARLAAEMRRGRCVDRALMLCGSLRAGSWFAETIERESRGQIRIVAVSLMPGLAGGCSFDVVEEAIRSDRVDNIFLAGYDGVVPEANLLLSRLAHFSVDVALLPDFQEFEAPLLRPGSIGVLATVDVAARPLSAVQAGLKRAEDILLAVSGLILTLPVLVLIAIAIKLDSPGPICYRQARAGFHDRTFRIWKFRTMRQGSDHGPLRQTDRNDSRVTRVGRLLRRTSMDELPQLLNVLCGEMSVVGPRPHAVTMTTAGLPLHTLLRGYASRHRMKPGITGWAQVNGSRGQVETEEALRRRVALDCHYIEHWSLALDVWIILRTLGMVAFDRNAY
jgi:Undecaprenyl-phosphate glucose phosphotransferase